MAVEGCLLPENNSAVKWSGGNGNGVCAIRPPSPRGIHVPARTANPAAGRRGGDERGERRGQVAEVQWR